MPYPLLLKGRGGAGPFFILYSWVRPYYSMGALHYHEGKGPEWNEGKGPEWNEGKGPTIRQGLAPLYIIGVGQTDISLS